MRIHTNKLDINKFKKDFVTLYRGKDKEQVLDRLVELINESDCSIPAFLRKVDLIEEKRVQESSRHAAVAQMYNVDLYNRGNSCYVETASYGEVVMIQVPISTGSNPEYSTIILSKYGDVHINEGEIWTHSGLNYGRGLIVRKIIDGKVSTKFGYMYAGARVLPCVFDYIEGHIGSLPDIYSGPFLIYLQLYGNIGSVSRDELQEVIDDYDREYVINCISEDSILFSLKTSGKPEMPDAINGIMAIRNNKRVPWNRDKITEALRIALSPILISKEKLQEIVESKTE